MTNEQLVVLLRSFIAQLEQATAKAEALLPDDVERHALRRYIGNNPLMAPLDRDPKCWETAIPDGAPSIALDSLREFIDDLALHVSTLEGE